MAADRSQKEIFEEFRSMTLTLNPKEIGLNKDNFPYPVFALVMEVGFPIGSFTLSTVADGSTSLYFSNGGGIIGSGGHESVQETSQHLLSEAQNFYQKAKKVKDFPKPKSGKVLFYFVTFDGIYSYEGFEENLEKEQDEFSDLFFSAHSVIMELRKIEDNLK